MTESIATQTPTLARPGERAESRTLVWLFVAALFLSSFLMFLLEPMVAKMILPLLGGAPMVWNTCVVFFQMTLLAGYAYAHAANVLGPRRHALGYALLLMVSCAMLPFTTRLVTAPTGDANPVTWLLLTLVTLIGLPFFVLSSTASVLQKWFSATDHPSARDPYFLYAASNLGSLLALLLYPVIVEPTFPLGLQRRLWSVAYIAFVALAGICATIAWSRRASRQPDTEQQPAAHAAAVTWQMRLKWVVLSFIPSSLMLGVTTYLSTDIAPVPLLWVLPLSLYLLTFVLAFGWGTSWGAIAARRLPLLVAALATFMVARRGVPAWLLIPLHLGVFVTAAMLCHGKLADERPDRESLTGFYFWIAFGGMLGGLFNTFAAPRLFTGIVEYPLVLLLACLVRAGYSQKTFSRQARAMDIIMPVAVGLVTASFVVLRNRPDASSWMLVAALGLPAIVMFVQSRYAVRFALSFGAMLLASSLAGSTYGRVLYAERTFFGTYRVSLDPTGRFRALFHGTTLHGLQAVDQSREDEPLTYFHWTGPFGQAFSKLPEFAKATDIAIVGLGVGSLASYAQPGQRWTFYEIDPAVERIARDEKYFTYLRNCGDRCQVVIGDARLSLTREEPGQYGLIVLDAFSSDAIPVHLMTREALSLYLSRLTPDGILAFHISNLHLTLGPVLARLATAHNLTVVEQRHPVDADQAAAGQTPSEWIVMARDRRQLEPLLGDARWAPPVASSSTPLWTDDFSNILSVLKLGKRTS